jgi:hypothetical protein
LDSLISNYLELDFFPKPVCSIQDSRVIIKNAGACTLSNSSLILKDDSHCHANLRIRQLKSGEEDSLSVSVPEEIEDNAQLQLLVRSIINYNIENIWEVKKVRANELREDSKISLNNINHSQIAIGDGNKQVQTTRYDESGAKEILKKIIDKLEVVPVENKEEVIKQGQEILKSRDKTFIDKVKEWIPKVAKYAEVLPLIIELKQILGI